MKRPAFQFYPDKWTSDKDLRRCSIGARGLWLELLCVMHTCEPYGHLVERDGSAMDDDGAARLCGVDLKVYRAHLAELEKRGVPSRTPAGVIYSRRMVRDEERRNEIAAHGKEAGKYGILGKEFGALGGRPRKDSGGNKTPLDDENTSTEKPPTETGEKPPREPPAVSASVFASEKHLKPALEFGEGDARQGSNGTSIPDKSGGVKGRKPSANWSSPDWVSATAQTLGMPRIQGESDELFADRVHTAANARRRA